MPPGARLFALSRENFRAGVVGTSIVLFFALLALAHSLPRVALIGLALRLARPLIRLLRGGRP